MNLALAGRVEVTSGRFLAIALPATLAQMTTPVLGLVATGAIGRLGDAVLLGAVAVGALLFDFAFWIFGSIRMGTAGLTAQALGRGERVELRAVLIRALLIAAAIGLALIVLHGPIADLAFLAMGASEGVHAAATLYFSVRILSAPFAIGNFAVLGWLVGIARTDIGLGLQVLIAAVNAVATVALVLYWDFGIAGAACANVLAEITGTLFGLIAAARLIGRDWRVPWRTVLDRARLVETVAVNRDIMIRTALIMSVILFFTAQGARHDDVTLAANAVLYNMVMVSAFFLDGFSTAAEQICGQSVGARDRAGFRRAVRLVLFWGLGFAAPATLALLAGGGPLIDLLSANEQVREVGRQFLPLAALTPLLGVAAFAYDGIYAGATWARDMRNMMLPAVALFFLAWWLTLPLGNTGLWLAYLAFISGRGIFLALRLPALERRTFG
ncbi:MATE family efflux transporter [Ancylobacter dichloromethanicus]|uniref:MATE family efflux transporter n=1 Tax=Ancylobacter dichloromethanicus TaxID=518825 RepID=A0A9W6MZM9_9HYPH|nr:MATE family efflux transporter [Ancylobacter dichloromethanicus]MBS7555072.1 MATE family efflux transporter [Ancylobacter dichloromethanicus]GLK72281.1 MATE family efflux transporter [Ancylobacter dichloromethanicus]